VRRALLRRGLAGPTLAMRSAVSATCGPSSGVGHAVSWVDAMGPSQPIAESYFFQISALLKFRENLAFKIGINSKKIQKNVK
jgi:hypothetical protein